MSVTRIENIPPVDQMPEWAQEAFHSSQFFEKCLERVSEMEKREAECKEYASKIAVSLWTSGYGDNLPQLVCDDLLAILTQIDNMIAGLRHE